MLDDRNKRDVEVQDCVKRCRKSFEEIIHVLNIMK